MECSSALLCGKRSRSVLSTTRTRNCATRRQPNQSGEPWVRRDAAQQHALEFEKYVDHDGRRFSWPPISHTTKLMFLYLMSSTLLPMVGDVTTTSSIKLRAQHHVSSGHVLRLCSRPDAHIWYRMVVLPALSRPTTITLTSGAASVSSGQEGSGRETRIPLLLHTHITPYPRRQFRPNQPHGGTAAAGALRCAENNSRVAAVAARRRVAAQTHTHTHTHTRKRCRLAVMHSRSPLDHCGTAFTKCSSGSIAQRRALLESGATSRCWQ
jgi:hypothetical protein